MIKKMKRSKQKQRNKLTVVQRARTEEKDLKKKEHWVWKQRKKSKIKETTYHDCLQKKKDLGTKKTAIFVVVLYFVDDLNMSPKLKPPETLYV